MPFVGVVSHKEFRDLNAIDALDTPARPQNTKLEPQMASKCFEGGSLRGDDVVDDNIEGKKAG